MSLFWRVFSMNAALLIVAALILGISPMSISVPIALTEAVVLGLGLVAMLIVNMGALRAAFAPLERLARHTEDVDLLRPGQRLAVTGRGEVAAFVRAFNEMLGRLEAERRESGRRAVAAQEAERRRIASELHDEVGQTMTAVLLLLERLHDGVAPERRQELAEAQQAVRTGLDEVRRIAQELRPEMLEHLGLVSALTALSRSFSGRTGLDVEHRFARDLPALDAEAELAVYRIAQESLTNVARHARARHVWLSLESGAESVVLRVVDDGRGLDGASSGSGGLRGMRERAVTVGATLAITTASTGGVEVRLDVPAARSDR